jgi:hypothetical protein
MAFVDIQPDPTGIFMNFGTNYLANNHKYSNSALNNASDTKVQAILLMPPLNPAGIGWWNSISLNFNPLRKGAQFSNFS